MDSNSFTFLTTRASSLGSFLLLLEKVENNTKSFSLYWCSNGDGRTGVFLSLCLSIERLETEDNVDIFQTVRWLRSQRAGLVSSQVNKLSFTLSALLGTDLPKEDMHERDAWFSCELSSL